MPTSCAAATSKDSKACAGTITSQDDDLSTNKDDDLTTSGDDDCTISQDDDLTTSKDKARASAQEVSKLLQVPAPRSKVSSLAARADAATQAAVKHWCQEQSTPQLINMQHHVSNASAVLSPSLVRTMSPEITMSPGSTQGHSNPQNDSSTKSNGSTHNVSSTQSNDSTMEESSSQGGISTTAGVSTFRGEKAQSAISKPLAVAPTINPNFKRAPRKPMSSLWGLAYPWQSWCQDPVATTESSGRKKVGDKSNGDDRATDAAAPADTHKATDAVTYENAQEDACPQAHAQASATAHMEAPATAHAEALAESPATAHAEASTESAATAHAQASTESPATAPAQAQDEVPGGLAGEDVPSLAASAPQHTCFASSSVTKMTSLAEETTATLPQDRALSSTKAKKSAVSPAALVTDRVLPKLSYMHYFMTAQILGKTQDPEQLRFNASRNHNVWSNRNLIRLGHSDKYHGSINFFLAQGVYNAFAELQQLSILNYKQKGQHYPSYGLFLYVLEALEKQEAFFFRCSCGEQQIVYNPYLGRYRDIKQACRRCQSDLASTAIS